jgi:hypothetical protein
VSDERPIGPGETDRIQFFDNGNVTLLDGKCQIWLHPEKRVERIDTSALVQFASSLSPEYSRFNLQRPKRPH